MRLSHFPGPNSTDHMTLDADVQVGCVLLQQQLDETTKQINSWSRLVKNIEHVYNTTQRECLAVVWAVFLL